MRDAVAKGAILTLGHCVCTLYPPPLCLYQPHTLYLFTGTARQGTRGLAEVGTLRRARVPTPMPAALQAATRGLLARDLYSLKVFAWALRAGWYAIAATPASIKSCRRLCLFSAGCESATGSASLALQ